MVCAFLKVMFFLRQSEQYGLMVQMIGNSMTASTTFLSFFMLWVIFFTLIYWNLKVEIPTEEYPNMWTGVQYLMYSYRAAIGDLATPGYSNWDNLSNQVRTEYFAKNSIMWCIWGFWLLQQFTVLIILLNFLIAVICQAYEEQYGSQQILKAKNRAELNREHFQFVKFFERFSGGLWTPRKFRVLVFQMDQTLTRGGGEEEYLGFVQTLKNYIQKTNKDLLKRYTAETSKVQKDVNFLKHNVLQVMAQIRGIKDALEKSPRRVAAEVRDLLREEEQQEVAKELWAKIPKVAPGGTGK